MNDELLEQVLRSPKLPSLPAVAMQIIDLVQQPDVSLDQLSLAISRDPALASKILRSANSGYYARSRRVTRLSEALMVLGLRRVKTLALGFSLVGDPRGKNGESFDHAAYWKRSLFAATVARTLAPHAGLRAQLEEAFLGGLTHCLGVLALNQALGEQYQDVVRAAGGHSAGLLPFERERLGLDHAAVGAALGEVWNLPPELIEGMRHYASPNDAPLELRRLVQCIAVGAYGADLLMGIALSEALPGFLHRCRVWFGIADADATTLLEEAQRSGLEMAALLDLPDPMGMSVSDILVLANEALAELTLNAEAENARLERENEQLESEASIDGLTGLNTRRRFDGFLDEHVRVAARYEAPLALMMIDLDHFKRVNDTYGHQAGDNMLQAVGRVVLDTVRETDLPARYGGEEFAIVLPLTDIRGACGLATRMLRAIAEHEYELPSGVRLGVTASIGIAAYAPEMDGPAEFVRAADAALYEAKAAGRNRVRISAMERSDAPIPVVPA
ncbi:MAG: GGDEF domain-containing protein [Chloroflexi bacterium]|nr:GGDEF domain-containing protein [Chloroflexota bacterium]